MSVGLTGKDTVLINGRIFNDLANGDCINLEFPNSLIEAKKGKNGNTIYNYNNSGKICNVTMRVIAGSPDDKFLNSLKIQMTSDPPTFPLMTANFIKRVGDGKGNVNSINYSINGGAFSKEVPTKENVEGDTETAVAVYTMVFGNSDRGIS